MRNLASTARTVGALIALTATMPVDLAVVGLSLLDRRRSVVHASGRTVMVSGGKMTKALSLARAFHSAGHRVVLVESSKYRFTGHRFSRAVDAFHCVPDPTDPDYALALRDVARREGVDVFVPVASPAASVHDADARRLLDDVCEVVHGDSATVRMLDDKASFSETASAMGLSVPEWQRITAPEQIGDFEFRPGRDYILKRIAYNPVGRMDLTRLSDRTPERNLEFAHSLGISEDDPWILQEFIEGQEYCTHGTVREGRLTVFACCESSAFQVNYAMIDKPEIRSWVEKFVKALGVTGQLSFDFIEGGDGHVYAIECNPRTHSAITMFYDHDKLAEAYLERVDVAVVPTPQSKPTYWIYHELWRLLTQPNRSRRLRGIQEGTDAIYARWDPLPYFLVHHLQIPTLLLKNALTGGSWSRIDFNIGKLVELGGD
ncbi:ATP-grasp enzyme [Gordonia McavH-238-E]|uniref:ATP-grasp domain-containing protein n=1 Tax=Gordonia sp. McavH-238-E TaxID=2917736 RepID=UPI001EF46EB6|nr:ATP-grasp domain-containing protein [Gordonia sp. McavH-238-E]MCG7634518.1 ATP-grasp enzyme [Gordonia sp. McavH-238-E]